jgi:hypothetical protein
MATFRLEPDPCRDRGDIIVGDPAERKRDMLLLGHLAESGPRRKLWLDISGEQVVAVLGKRGTGKSYTLGTLVEGLGAGQGTTPIAVLQTPRASLIFDIMDIFWTTALPLVADGPAELVKQYQTMTRGGFATQNVDLDVWIPSGFENPGIDPPGVRPLFVRASDLEIDDWAAMFEVDIYGEPRGMLIADLITHVSTAGYTKADGSGIPANSAYEFNDLLACLDTDADIQTNYRPDTIRSVRQRMATYGALPLFSGGGTPLRDLLQAFRTSVVMLARVPDALKKVLVAVLVRRILRERRDASLAQKRLDLDARLSEADRGQLLESIRSRIPRTWLLMDEAHILAGASEPSVAREAFVKYAKEGRNYGLSLALATQQPSALDPRLMSQVETAIIHQFTDPRDATVASQAMRSALPTSIAVDGMYVDMTTLLRRLGQGLAVFSSGNAPALQRVCVTAIRPRISAHGGYEA